MTRILIVEDEPVIAFDLKMTLIKLNYDVCGIAFFGQDALNKTAEFIPDLVIMDIKLNDDMDGIEAGGHIQNNFNIPVIFITAYADKNTLERIKKINPYGYFLKPYDENELHVNIILALNKNKPQEILNQEKIVSRSFEFPENLYQAGMFLLSFINTILISVLPDDNIKVHLEQEKLRIRLIIESQFSSKAKINQIIETYGMMLQYKFPPESFFKDKSLISNFQQLMEITKFQIEKYIQTHSVEGSTSLKNIAESIKTDIIWLTNHIAVILKYSDENINNMRKIAEDTLKILELKDSRILSSIDYIIAKLNKGLTTNNEKNIKEAFSQIKKENFDIFYKINNFIYGMIIKGTLGGLNSTLIYRWMREV